MHLISQTQKVHTFFKTHALFKREKQTTIYLKKEENIRARISYFERVGDVTDNASTAFSISWETGGKSLRMRELATDYELPGRR